MTPSPHSKLTCLCCETCVLPWHREWRSLPLPSGGHVSWTDLHVWCTLWWRNPHSSGIAQVKRLGFWTIIFAYYYFRQRRHVACVSMHLFVPVYLKQPFYAGESHAQYCRSIKGQLTLVAVLQKATTHCWVFQLQSNLTLLAQKTIYMLFWFGLFKQYWCSQDCSMANISLILWDEVRKWQLLLLLVTKLLLWRCKKKTFRLSFNMGAQFGHYF